MELALVLLTIATSAQAAERVTNGDFSAGAAGWTAWTVSGQPVLRTFNSAKNPAGGTGPCFELASGASGVYTGGIYQALSLVPGQLYTVSALSKDLNSAAHATADVLIGTAQPQTGQDYFDDGKTQSPPGTLHLFGWNGTQCRGWNGSETSACVGPLRFQFIAPATTLYLVIRCSPNAYDISFDNVSVRNDDSCTPAKITAAPQSQHACLGSSITFHVGASGTEKLLFQWRRNDQDLINGPHFVNVNGPTLTVVNVDGTVIGKYTCKVSNDCGSDVSDAAELTTDIVYVDAKATGRQDGSSWLNAYTDLQFALFNGPNTACGGAEIWVANGVYKPTFDPDLTDIKGTTFVLVDKVGMYGGFEGASQPVLYPGGETDRTQRRPTDPANATVLTNDDANSRYVITSINNPPTTVVDGFIIAASPGKPAGCVGEFNFKNSQVTLQNNLIQTDAGRFLDLSPDPAAQQQPLQANNRFLLNDPTITTSPHGRMLELRQFDFDADPENLPGAFQKTASPGYDDPWAIDTLDTSPGQRVTLTDRKGMAFHGDHEVAYVRNLILREGAVLNTAMHRIYYQNLLKAPSSRIINVPLHGMSLDRIGMDSDSEFECLIRREPDVPVEAIQRIPDARGPGNGVMRLMRVGNGPVAVKGRFSRAGEDFVTLNFEYRFFGNPTELIVSLSDSTSANAANIPVARIRPPKEGRPGAAGAPRFGLFQGRFAHKEINLRNGVFVRLELIAQKTGLPAAPSAQAQSLDPPSGPQPAGEGGDGVDIDNWGAHIVCSYGCADLSGNGVPDDRDYLLVLSLYGRNTAQVEMETGDCSDSIFGGDQYIDLTDLLSWDLVLDPSGALPDACSLLNGSGFLTSERITRDALVSASPISRTPVASAQSADTGPYVLVAGKTNADPWQEDALYTVDMAGSCTGGSPGIPAGGEASRSNGRLVRDRHNQAYQIHGISYPGEPQENQGLIRLSDYVSIIPPRTGLPGPSGNTVSVGLSEVSAQLVGVPITDVAPHPAEDGVFYVVPVQVTPGDGSCSYKAAARLKLQAGEPPYTVEALYGTNPAPGSSVSGGDCSNSIIYEPDTQQLRDVEVDAHQMVFITSAQGAGDNDYVLVYNGSTSLSGQLSPILTRSVDGVVDAPMALTLSAAADDLYLASSMNALPGVVTRIYRFSIQRSGGTVTGLTASGTVDISNPPTGDLGYGLIATVSSINEAPDGSVYVVGLTVPKVPADLSTDDPDGLYASLFGPYPGIPNPVFSTPTFAHIPTGFAGPVAATALSCFDLALPVSSIIVDSTPPALVSALSRKTHGAAGDFDIDLPLAGVPASESRSGGPTQVILTFSEPIKAVDGSIGSNEISPSSGVLVSAIPASNSLTVNLTGATDAACLTITLSGLADLSGNQLPATAVKVRVLQGDVDGNGTVNLADINLVKSGSSQQASSLNFRADFNLDGEIDCADILRSRARLANGALCP